MTYDWWWGIVTVCLWSCSLHSGKEYVCVVKLHNVVKESQFAKVLIHVLHMYMHVYS